VPEHIAKAVARADERDDREKWQRALHQEWRDAKRVARTDAQAKAYDEFRKAHNEKLAEELARRGINPSDLGMKL
jgi:hypothetical protein